MHDLQSKITEFLAKNPDIEIVWLYGSRARNTHHENSDYDLAFALNKFDLSLTDRKFYLNDIEIDLAEHLAVSQHDISCVDINAVPIYLAYSIIAEGKVLIGSDTVRLYKEQQRIMSQYEFQQVEHQHDT